MNILIIHEIDWINKVVFEPHHFAELFSIKGHKVFVIYCQNASLKDLSEGFHTSIIQNYNRIYKNASVTLIRPPSILIKGLNRMTHFLSCENVIRNTVLQNKIDVILLYGAATNGIQSIKVAKEMNVPVIFRVLDVAHGLVKTPLLKQLAKKYERIVISNATKVLTTTNELANYAIEMGSVKEKVEYFPLGINAHDFKPQSKDLQLAKILGISEQDKVIVFVGTIFEFSGLDEIITKFEIIKKKIPNVKFLIVGGGPYFARLKSMITQTLENDIILTGFKPQKEIPKYISLADICINSFNVNFVTDRILPIKVLEYLACGKPVLSTPLRGTKEFLQDEDFGVIYSTTEKLVDTLSNIINDGKRLHEIGEKGYEYVKKHHDWDVLSDKLIKEFETLILHKNKTAD